MSEEYTLDKSKEVYSTLKLTLELRNLKFENYDDDLILRCGFTNEADGELPIDLTIRTLAKEQLILVLSKLPFNMPQDKMVDGALAVSLVNYGLPYGSFDYNPADGSIIFRLSESYFETDVGIEHCWHIIRQAAITCNKYIDKFYMLANNILTFEGFLKSCNT